ncbi:type IV pilin PilA [Microcystis sp. 0824]|nr:type IV pilin PilA [Microcystis sp. 0824]
MRQKVFPRGRLWGFTHFWVVNYLIFREKVPQFSPRPLPDTELFDVKKA